MSPELADAIREDYPHLSADYGDRSTNMAAGFAIADGWVQLFQQLLAEIEAKRLSLPPELAAKVKLAQVKEKWGGLRVYVDGATAPMRAALDRAEEESFRVCERCGTSGEDVYPAGSGWIRTLCPVCRSPN